MSRFAIEEHMNIYIFFDKKNCCSAKHIGISCGRRDDGNEQWDHIYQANPVEKCETEKYGVAHVSIPAFSKHFQSSSSFYYKIRLYLPPSPGRIPSTDDRESWKWEQGINPLINYGNRKENVNQLKYCGNNIVIVQWNYRRTKCYPTNLLSILKLLRRLLEAKPHETLLCCRGVRDLLSSSVVKPKYRTECHELSLWWTHCTILNCFLMPLNHSRSESPELKMCIDFLDKKKLGVKIDQRGSRQSTLKATEMIVHALRNAFWDKTWFHKMFGSVGISRANVLFPIVEIASKFHSLGLFTGVWSSSSIFPSLLLSLAELVFLSPSSSSSSSSASTSVGFEYGISDAVYHDTAEIYCKLCMKYAEGLPERDSFPFLQKLCDIYLQIGCDDSIIKLLRPTCKDKSVKRYSYRERYSRYSSQKSTSRGSEKGFDDKFCCSLRCYILSRLESYPHCTHKYLYEDPTIADVLGKDLHSFIDCEGKILYQEKTKINIIDYLVQVFNVLYNGHCKTSLAFELKGEKEREKLGSIISKQLQPEVQVSNYSLISVMDCYARLWKFSIFRDLKTLVEESVTNFILHNGSKSLVNVLKHEDFFPRKRSKFSSAHPVSLPAKHEFFGVFRKCILNIIISSGLKYFKELFSRSYYTDIKDVLKDTRTDPSAFGDYIINVLDPILQASRDALDKPTDLNPMSSHGISRVSFLGIGKQQVPKEFDIVSRHGMILYEILFPFLAKHSDISKQIPVLCEIKNAFMGLMRKIEEKELPYLAIQKYYRFFQTLENNPIPFQKHPISLYRSLTGTVPRQSGPYQFVSPEIDNIKELIVWCTRCFSMMWNLRSIRVIGTDIVRRMNEKIIEVQQSHDIPLKLVSLDWFLKEFSRRDREFIKVIQTIQSKENRGAFPIMTFVMYLLKELAEVQEEQEKDVAGKEQIAEFTSLFNQIFLCEPHECFMKQLSSLSDSSVVIDKETESGELLGSILSFALSLSESVTEKHGVLFFVVLHKFIKKHMSDDRKIHYQQFLDDFYQFFKSCPECMKKWKDLHCDDQQSVSVVRTIVKAFGASLPPSMKQYEIFVKVEECIEDGVKIMDILSNTRAKFLSSHSIAEITAITYANKNIDKMKLENFVDSLEIVSRFVDPDSSLLHLCNLAHQKDSQDNSQTFAILQERMTERNLTRKSLEALLFFIRRRRLPMCRILCLNFEEAIKSKKEANIFDAITQFTESIKEDAKEGANLVRELSVTAQKNLLNALSDDKFTSSVQDLVFKGYIQIILSPDGTTHLQLKGNDHTTIISEESIRMTKSDARWNGNGEFVSIIDDLEAICDVISQMYINGVIQHPTGDPILWQYHSREWDDQARLSSDTDSCSVSQAEGLKNRVISELHEIKEILAKKYENSQKELSGYRNDHASSIGMSGLTGKDISTFRNASSTQDIEDLWRFHFHSKASSELVLTPFSSIIKTEKEIDRAFGAYDDVLKCLDGLTSSRAASSELVLTPFSSIIKTEKEIDRAFGAYDDVLKCLDGLTSSRAGASISVAPSITCNGFIKISEGLALNPVLSKEIDDLGISRGVTAASVFFIPSSKDEENSILLRIPSLFLSQKSFITSENILFCSSFTSLDEIDAFFLRAKAYRSLHAILRCEELPIGILKGLVEKLKSIYRNEKIAVFCPHFLREEFKGIHISLDSFTSLKPLSEYRVNTPHAYIHVSDLPSNGKSHYIRYKLAANPDLQPFHLSRNCSLSQIVRDIESFVRKSNADSVGGKGILWVDLGRCDLSSDEGRRPSKAEIRRQKELENFLFSLIYLRSIRSSGAFIRIADDVDIHIEVQSSANQWLYNSIKHIHIEASHIKSHHFTWGDVMDAVGCGSSPGIAFTNNLTYDGIASIYVVIKSCMDRDYLPQALPVITHVEMDLIQRFFEGKIPELGHCISGEIDKLTYGLLYSIGQAAFRFVMTIKSHGFYCNTRPEDIPIPISDAFFKEVWHMVAKEMVICGRCGTDYAFDMALGKVLKEKVFSWEKQKRPLLIFNPSRLLFASPESTGSSRYSIPKSLIDFFKLTIPEKEVDFAHLFCIEGKEDLRSEFVTYSGTKLDQADISGCSPSYELTTDNLFKALQIQSMLYTEQLVILRAEAGVGKTSLVRFLLECMSRLDLLSTRNVNDSFKKVILDAGSTPNKLLSAIQDANQMAEKAWETCKACAGRALPNGYQFGYGHSIKGNTTVPSINFDFECRLFASCCGNIREKAMVVLFIDEANASDLIDMVTCLCKNRSVGGINLHENVSIVIAANPYRNVTPSAELPIINPAKSDGEEFTAAASAIYRVHPMSPSLLCRMMDFGELSNGDTEKYLTKIIGYSPIIQHAAKLSSCSDSLLKELTQILIKAHKFVQNKAKGAAWNCSLRDPQRFILIMDVLMKYKNEVFHVNRPDVTPKQYFIKAWCVAIMLTYEMRIPSLEWRWDFKNFIGYEEKLSSTKKRHRFRFSLFSRRNYGSSSSSSSIVSDDYVKGGKIKNYEKYATEIGKKLTADAISECKKEIANCRSLWENFLANFICRLSRIPLLLMGSPGSSKTLSVGLANSYLKKIECTKSNIPTIFPQTYQGSESSDSAGIMAAIKRARDCYTKEQVMENRFLCILCIDELGLADKSPNNPLKVLHEPLEPSTDEKVPLFSFIGNSNHLLDAAPTSRCLLCFRPPLRRDEMCEISHIIMNSYDTLLACDCDSIVDALVDGHMEAVRVAKRIGKGGMIGNRDLYGFVASVAKLEDRSFEKVGHCAIRCYKGVHDDVFDAVKKILIDCRLFKLERPQSVITDVFDTKDILEAISQSVLESDVTSRHICLRCSPQFVPFLKNFLQIQCIRNGSKQHVRVLNGSTFKRDIVSGEEGSERLEEVINIAQNGDIGILDNFGNVGALFDLLNKNHSSQSNVEYCRIAIGSSGNRHVEVKKGTRFILIFPEEMFEHQVVSNEISALIQRLEKIKIDSSDNLRTVFQMLEFMIDQLKPDIPDFFDVILSDTLMKPESWSIPTNFFGDPLEFAIKTFLSVVFETFIEFSEHRDQDKIRIFFKERLNIHFRGFGENLFDYLGDQTHNIPITSKFLLKPDTTSCNSIVFALKSMIPICVVNVSEIRQLNSDIIRNYIMDEFFKGRRRLSFKFSDLKSSNFTSRQDIKSKLLDIKSKLKDALKYSEQSCDMSEDCEESWSEKSVCQYYSAKHKLFEGSHRESSMFEAPLPKNINVIFVYFEDKSDIGGEFSQSQHLNTFISCIKSECHEYLGKNLFVACICQSKKSHIYVPQPDVICSFANFDALNDGVPLIPPNFESLFNQTCSHIPVPRDSNEIFHQSCHLLLGSGPLLPHTRSSIVSHDVKIKEKISIRCKKYLAKKSSEDIYKLLVFPNFMELLEIFRDSSLNLSDRFNEFVMIICNSLLFRSLLESGLMVPILSTDNLIDSSSSPSSSHSKNSLNGDSFSNDIKWLVDTWYKYVDFRVNNMICKLDKEKKRDVNSHHLTKQINDLDSSQKAILGPTEQRERRPIMRMKDEEEEEEIIDILSEEEEEEKVMSHPYIIDLSLGFFFSKKELPLSIPLPYSISIASIPFPYRFYRAFCDEISSNHWPFHDFRYNSLSFIPKYWTIPHAISLCSLAVSISGLPVDSDNISVVGSIEIGKDIETVVANILLPLIESEKKGEEERKKEDVEEEEEEDEEEEIIDILSEEEEEEKVMSHPYIIDLSLGFFFSKKELPLSIPLPYSISIASIPFPYRF
ncbi:E3 ubiquitin-protein ligase RNF213 like protein, partial [Aduncisulcus paluster]